MAGRILKIASNDVHGKVDDRKVVVFAAFEHIKYMNNYVVFSFEEEYDKNKLYYGSVHLKTESLVIFAVKDDIKKYIDEFLDEYEKNDVKNYRILDIDNMQKIEIVSYNMMDYEKLQLLDEMSIFREVKVEKTVNESKPIFLYIILFLLISFAIGLTVLYFNPSMFGIEYKELLCSNNLYDNNIKMNYDIDKDISFDENGKVESINVNRIYTFLDSNDYYEFKDNNKHEEYFMDGEGYKYVDDALQFRVLYQEDSVIDSYNEMLDYLQREGFSCIEK